MTEYLTTEDVLTLIGDLGVGPVRDLGLLDSAVHRPSVTLCGAGCERPTEHRRHLLGDSVPGQ
ncbi:hypothetical protein [Brachybacterium timonense]|mgnify:CR=1 FL=1|uniref:hypothetical protein n=1 Tax=Brachybacterium timonense TaxID=2050896 RepID=UPI001FE7C4FA|nr:hypothetical protein [Brachybacterium timonense]